jgi:hypothetical protein
VPDILTTFEFSQQIFIKVKVTFTPEQAMKALKGIEVYLYSFFLFGTRWR